MIDYWQKEKENAERWAHDTTRTIGLKDLTYLAINGFGRCEYNCSSRDICGDYACACVRTVFPNEQAYTLYETLRAQYLELLAIGHLFNDQDGATNND